MRLSSDDYHYQSHDNLKACSTAAAADGVSNAHGSELLEYRDEVF
jgi:hypothetical protein